MYKANRSGAPSYFSRVPNALLCLCCALTGVYTFAFHNKHKKGCSLEAKRMTSAQIRSIEGHTGFPFTFISLQVVPARQA